MSSNPIVALNDASAATQHLFCFHHAGGAAVAFRDWVKHLPSHIAICAAVLPGRERRFGEAFHEHLHPAAEELADAVAELWPDHDNVALFGHSLGGLTAFEVALRLEADDFEFSRLIISGVSPEAERSPRYGWSDAELVAFMRDMGGTPQEVFDHPELLAMMLPILRADLKLVDTYSPVGRGTVRAPVSVIGGRLDDHLDVERLRNWSQWAGSTFERKLFDGGHFYLDEHREGVLEWLSETLDQA